MAFLQSFMKKMVNFLVSQKKPYYNRYEFLSMNILR